MVGQSIGSYRVLDQLGQGGMGTVFLAEHRHLHRKAAIKVLLKEFVSRPDLLERFFAEARATSLIEHPGIVQIFDCEVDGEGRPYIVMEYLGGETLAGHLSRHGALPAGEAAAYARCMAEALAAAHDKGIIHRDIKPDNVFVKPGPPPAAKLVDFGIAKLAGEFHAGLKNRTQTGIVMGTPLYMSPEQCRGAGTVDYRTDIYSLGCVLFEMLAGRPPFQHEGGGELVVAHLTEAPPRLSSLVPAVPPGLDQLVAAMLGKTPAERPQTMRQVAEQLGAPATITGPGPVRPATPVPPESTRTPMPPAMTTLHGTASELRLPDEGELTVPRRRGGLVVALVALVVAAGGVWAWRRMDSTGASASPGEAPVAGPPAPAEPVAARAAAPPPAPVKAAPPPARRPGETLGGAIAATPAAPPRERPRRPRPRAAAATSPPPQAPLPTEPRHDIRVDVQSEPAGANVCLEGERRLIGRTPHAFTLPRDGRRLTVLLQLPGFRLKELPLKADRDLERSVKLEPLGTDELAPPAACR